MGLIHNLFRTHFVFVEGENKKSFLETSALKITYFTLRIMICLCSRKICLTSLFLYPSSILYFPTSVPMHSSHFFASCDEHYLFVLFILFIRESHLIVCFKYMKLAVMELSQRDESIDYILRLYIQLDG